MEYKNVLALQNFGNMCYLNSALQCLFSLDDFRNLISQSRFHALNDLCKKYEDSSIPLANPIIVKHMFGENDLFFRNNMQQDSHECLIRMLDIIHETIKDLSIPNERRNPITQSEISFHKYIQIFGRSFITDIFSGQIKSTLICQNCKKDRSSYEVINNISLPLSEPNSGNIVDIVDCFRDFFAPEYLEDMLTCDHCKAKTPTTKSLKISMYPKVLILHLKRFDFKSTQHFNPAPPPAINNVMVDISENLIFRSSKGGSKEVSNVNYKLKCIVNHFGSSPNSGHYTSIAKYNNEWVNIDDCNIYKTSTNLFTSPNSYVIIYEAV